MDTPYNQSNNDGDEVAIIPSGTDMEALIASGLAIIADLERERIAVQREQQTVVLRGLEISDNADRRQNETVVRGIEAENEQDKRRHIQVVIAICLGVGVPMALLTLVLVMAIFGSERQSQIALDILRVAGIALGGGGFIFAVGFAISRLIRR